MEASTKPGRWSTIRFFAYCIAHEANHRGQIEIALRVNGSLQMRIRDHGPGLPTAIGEGIGLANTRRRLNHLYGDAQKFILQNPDDGGLGITILVPYRE